MFKSNAITINNNNNPIYSTMCRASEALNACTWLLYLQPKYVFNITALNMTEAINRI